MVPGFSPGGGLSQAEEVAFGNDAGDFVGDHGFPGGVAAPDGGEDIG